MKRNVFIRQLTPMCCRPVETVRVLHSLCYMRVGASTLHGGLHARAQNEFVRSFKHAARREMSEAHVNAAMYVQFEANSNVVRAADIAVGGTLSTTAITYDLTHLLAGRSLVCCINSLRQSVLFTPAKEVM